MRVKAKCNSCPHNCIIEAEVFEEDNLDKTTYCVLGWKNPNAYFKVKKSENFQKQE